VESRGKEAVITELIDLLDTSGALMDRDVALEAVLARERLQSTGMGAGIAIPHGKCNAVREVVMAIGIAPEPVDFGSVDGRPVRIIFLLVSPTDQMAAHIQALAAISRLMLDEGLRRQLEQADSVEAVDELLSKQQGE
jgi:fructose-specific phosphotransferase system IIA component